MLLSELRKAFYTDTDWNNKTILLDTIRWIYHEWQGGARYAYASMWLNKLAGGQAIASSAEDKDFAVTLSEACEDELRDIVNERETITGLIANVADYLLPLSDLEVYAVRGLNAFAARYVITHRRMCAKFGWVNMGYVDFTLCAPDSAPTDFVRVTAYEFDDKAVFVDVEDLARLRKLGENKRAFAYDDDYNDWQITSTDGDLYLTCLRFRVHKVKMAVVNGAHPIGYINDAFFVSGEGNCVVVDYIRDGADCWQGAARFANASAWLATLNYNARMGDNSLRAILWNAEALNAMQAFVDFAAEVAETLGKRVDDDALSFIIDHRNKFGYDVAITYAYFRHMQEAREGRTRLDAPLRFVWAEKKAQAKYERLGYVAFAKRAKGEAETLILEDAMYRNFANTETLLLDANMFRAIEEAPIGAYYIQDGIKIATVTVSPDAITLIAERKTAVRKLKASK